MIITTRRASLIFLAAVLLPATAAQALAPGGGHGKPLGTGTPLQWTWANPTPSADKFTLLVQGGGLYVAAGQDGVIYMSPDGTNWSPESGPIGNGGTYQDAIFGGGLFVLAGVDASGVTHAASSSDGVHWTDAVLSLKADPGLTLAYGNGTFVVMDSDSTETSSDGTHWTLHGLSFIQIQGSPVLSCINKLCVSFGYDSPTRNNQSVYVSGNDGATWNKSTLRNLGLDGSISNNGSTFFLFDGLSPGSIYISTDGNIWTKQTGNGFIPYNPYWDGTRFLAVHVESGVSILYTSTDGVTWTKGSAITSPSTQIPDILSGPHQVANTGSGYIAAGLNALQIVQSTDFATWTPLFSGSSGSSTGLRDIITVNGRYVGVGATPGSLPIVMQSADGVTWNTVYTGTKPGQLNTVAYGNGVYVASGVLNVNTAPFATYSAWLYSTDGTHWVGLNPPGLIIGDVVYGNGEFVAFMCPNSGCGDQTSDESVTSQDGLTWVRHAMPVEFVNDAAQLNIGFNGRQFIALGAANGENEGTVYVSSDGINWTSGGSFPELYGTVFTRIRAFGTGFGAVGSFSEPCPGDPSGCVVDISSPIAATSPDGITWTATTPLGPNVFQSQLFSDIVYTGHDYFAADPAGDIAASTDGIHWCDIDAFPIVSSPDTLALNGSQMVAADAEGGILTTTVSAGSSSPGFTCKDAVTGGAYTSSGSGGGSTGGTGSTGSSSGGGGELDLLTLGGLLGFAALRRRRWGRG